MEPNIAEIAERVRAIREACGFTTEEMAEATGVEESRYIEYESGTRDFTFTFLYRCAEKCGVDIVDLLTGGSPHLSEYAVVRAGGGLPMKRREGFNYYLLAATFKNKTAEPFLVEAPYREEDRDRPITLSSHQGQEFDYVISGKMTFVLEDHRTELGPGDSIYYDSGRPHGMVASDKDGCVFLAIIMKEEESC
ncbi:MAG: XRE family transcriptional regulator [Candidatus Methanomethylophilaceae archaeon]|nr:XRE family transcriptional regulator [Candidatus Methanomethylophilaceae archaeon]